MQHAGRTRIIASSQSISMIYVFIDMHFGSMQSLSAQNAQYVVAPRARYRMRGWWMNQYICLATSGTASSAATCAMQAVRCTKI